jgi:nucleoside-diphosphate-sugar epimerase
MKYLILGSSGQIGAHLSDYLARQGDSVVPFDLVRDPAEDLRFNLPLLIDRMRDVDFVFFLAFDVGGSIYLQRNQASFQFISNNVKILAVTFDALHSLRKPFAFASSQMANMGQSSYGVLKSVGDFYTKSLEGLVVKLWNVYGIEKDEAKSHVITDFINRAKHQGKIEMRSNGQEERQFLYAEDCSEALRKVSCLYHALPRDRPLHISSFKWTKILDIAQIIGSLMGVPVIPGSKAMDFTQGFRKNEPDPYILEHWRPSTTLENGIRQIIAKMSEH